MHDEPTPAELVTTVARLLRQQVVPALTGALAFEVRVAANALDLAARQLLEPAGVAQAERARLVALTGEDGSIADLTALLAEHIATGDPALPPDALDRHLLATTLARLAIDQPRYGGIARAASVFGALPPPDQEPAP